MDPRIDPVHSPSDSSRSNLPFVIGDAQQILPEGRKKLNGEALYAAIFDRDLSPYFEADVVDIHVPLKRIFYTNIQKMGARPPHCRYRSSIDGMIEVSVSFEVPAEYSTSKTTSHEEIKSDPSTTLELAGDSAFQKCFHHLASKHKIFVVDFGARQAQKHDREARKTIKRILEVNKRLDTLIQKWSNAIASVKNLAKLLQTKTTAEETVYQIVSDAGNIYSKVSEFLGSIADKSNGQVAVVRDEQKKYGDNCESFMQFHESTRSDICAKDGKKFVYFNEKDVLAYVLQCIKRPEAEYKNKISADNYMMKGYVTVNLGVVPNVRCSGRLQIPGDLEETSSLAEENAAGKAILQLEEKYKVNVKDLNYTDRVRAKERVEYLGSVEWKLKEIAESVFGKWSNMMDYINMSYDLYGFSGRDVSESEKKAMDFCTLKINLLEEETKVSKDSAAQILKDFHN
ncbi:hypothetical protein ACP70R_023254 [Stipagrostis hirtigluma subsp. patula]